MEQPEPGVYVVARIQEALAQDPRVSEMDLEVTLAGDRVFVTGDVHTPERHDAITQIVSEVCPDCRVMNQTHVLQQPEPEEMETLG